jgi:hypothetical protein
VTAEPGSVLARAIEALGRFPTDPPWVLIGGIAVFIRLGSVTRATADVDTIARSQASLIQRLVDDDFTTVVSGGDIEVPIGAGSVEIDVMDLADDPLPADSERRAFALARRTALAAAARERIIVSDRGGVVIADARISVASVSALVALKTVAMVRRPRSNSPQKVGSDIHDLVRLVASSGGRATAYELVAIDRDLARWVCDQVARAFGDDLRYTLIRLRTNDRSVAAQALADDDVAATVVLADALRELLAES